MLTTDVKNVIDKLYLMKGYQSSATDECTRCVIKFVIERSVVFTDWCDFFGVFCSLFVFVFCFALFFVLFLISFCWFLLFLLTDFLLGFLISILNVPDEGYSRNGSCTPNLISTFSFIIHLTLTTDNHSTTDTYISFNETIYWSNTPPPFPKTKHNITLQVIEVWWYVNETVSYMYNHEDTFEDTAANTHMFILILY